jgi:iron complex outermembrane recepter protein
LQLGLRYTSEEQDFYTTVSNFFGTRGIAEDLQGEGANQTPGVYEVFLGDVPVTKGESWSNVGGKLGLDFQLNEDMMVYGYYARGFKSGGFVGRIVIPEDSGPFDEEYVDTYEIGIKTELLDRTLRLNVAAFFNQYDDMQLANIYFTEDAFGNTVNGNTILNAANAETSGLEVDLLWMPTNSLRINASLGLLNAEYTDFVYGADKLDLSGQTLQNSPETTANLGLEYTAQIQSLELRSSIQYKYVSKKWDGNIVNSPRSEVQPTNLVDVNIDLSDPNSNWSLGIWAMNLMDERYISNSFVAAGVVGLVDYQPPRTYGMTLSLSF